MQSTWKNFELRVLLLSRRLKISVSDLMAWKYTDIITAMQLMGI